MLALHKKNDILTFRVFIQPRSSKNQVAGLYGDALKIKLTAPPVDGEANKMCIKFLAKLLSVSKSAVEIVSGQTSRNKTIKITADVSTLEKLEKKIKSLSS